MPQTSFRMRVVLKLMGIVSETETFRFTSFFFSFFLPYQNNLLFCYLGGNDHEISETVTKQAFTNTLLHYLLRILFD